jgi:ferrous iron transport protein A
MSLNFILVRSSPGGNLSMIRAIPDAFEMLPMDRLQAGETAEIIAVVGSAEQVHRLRELGLREGAEISVIQAGSPCIIRLAGQRLCFRPDELLKVLVRPTAAV